MKLATTLVIELPSKSLTLTLPRPMDIWQAREFTRTYIGTRTLPTMTFVSGDTARATYHMAPRKEHLASLVQA